MKASHIPFITGILLSVTFTGIALYVLLFRENFPAASKQDLMLYASLTGAYGIWRAFRVWLQWKEQKKNI